MAMEKGEDGFYTGKPAETAAPAPTAEAAAIAPAGEEVSVSQLVQSTYDVQVTLADSGLDPNSPLYSVKTFEELGLHKDLLDGLYAMGFTKPSKIQEKALPLLLRDPPMNMIGQSQSGTGKTAAFVLTMLSRIDFDKNAPQALCLAPSRELARQIMSVVATMGKGTPVQTEYAIKEHLPKDVSRITAHVVVGTPGTMAQLIQRRIIDVTNVKVFVLDEADNMIDMGGLGDQTIRVKNMLPKQGVQVLLFSATFPDHVRKFADKIAPGANKIELKREELSVEGIKQFYLDCKDEAQKYNALVMLYQLLTIGQSIIFCQHRTAADRIAQRMIAEGHKVASLHGAKDGEERDKIIDDFREGRQKVLITTNVIARGIDIQQVNMVVNYDLPLASERETQGEKAQTGKSGKWNLQPDIETYIHRIGRTGRFGRKGVSINFVHNKETFDQLMVIQDAIGKTIPKISAADEDTMEEELKAALKA